MDDISTIVLNFRDALRAMVPIAERVGIPWRDGESYDEWDGIAQALFSALVVAVVPWPDGRERKFAEYDMRYENYGGLRRIVVRTPSAMELHTFVAFSTREAPFDSIRVLNTDTRADQTSVISANNVEFFISDI